MRRRMVVVMMMMKIKIIMEKIRFQQSLLFSPFHHHHCLFPTVPTIPPLQPIFPLPPHLTSPLQPILPPPPPHLTSSFSPPIIPQFTHLSIFSFTFSISHHSPPPFLPPLATLLCLGKHLHAGLCCLPLLPLLLQLRLHAWMGGWIGCMVDGWGA